MQPQSRVLPRGGPLLLLCMVAYVALVMVQILPLSLLRPLKALGETITRPYLVQSWRFFSPEPPQENRITLLRIRYETNGQILETEPLPVTPMLLGIYRSRRWAPPRLVYLMTNIESRLWYPHSPWLGVYARALSGLATGINRRAPLGRILAVRSTVFARPIPSPRNPVARRDQLILDTGWLAYHPDVAPL